MSRFTTIQHIPPTRDTVVRYGVQVPSKPDEYRFNCPYCGDNSGKFYVNLKSGYYHCFRGCGAAKGRIGSIHLIDKMTITTTDLQSKQKKEIQTIHFSLEGGGIEVDIVKGYLYSRNINDDVIRMFGLKGAIVFNHYAAAFPVKTPLADTKYWGYRLINHEKIRYYTDFPKVLYGHPTTLTSSVLYLQEGVFDVLCSLPQRSVCLFGKSISTEQLQLLKHFTCAVVLVCLDSLVDQNKKEQLAMKVRMATGKKVGIVHLPDGKDPGELGKSIENCDIMW